MNEFYLPTPKESLVGGTPEWYANILSEVMQKHEELQQQEMELSGTHDELMQEMEKLVRDKLAVHLAYYVGKLEQALLHANLEEALTGDNQFLRALAAAIMKSEMVHPPGFEPGTHALKVRCSKPLS